MAVAYGGLDAAARRAAIEARITAARVVELFDDDGDGLVAAGDLATLATIMGDADDIVTGLLINKGFNEEQLEILALDRQVIRAWAGIAAQLAGERKPEWLDEQGHGPFDAFGVRARAELKALARGEIRSVQEGVAGLNSALSGSVDTHPFEFSPDPSIPGDRGRGSF
jgi:hypothetical protein